MGSGGRNEFGALAELVVDLPISIRAAPFILPFSIGRISGSHGHDRAPKSSASTLVLASQLGSPSHPDLRFEDACVQPLRAVMLTRGRVVRPREST